MRKAMSITLVLVLALSVAAFAKPVDDSGTLDKLMYLDASGQKSDLSGTGNVGVFGAAQAGTTFYGGTFWAADSNRWEANEDGVWTFDTGIGSDIVPSSNPAVDPNKLAGLHGTMNGWVGFDNSYSEITFFRRLEASDGRWGADVCVGAGANLGGNASFWCGVFPAEADERCYSAGSGYGNAWVVCIRKAFAYTGGGVTLDFDYVNETESGFDFGQVVVDTAGNGDLGDEILVTQYDGVLSGHESLALSPGLELPSAAGPVIVKFCVSTDGAWSDEDGRNPTDCGAFAVDNVLLAGGIIDGPSTFETGTEHDSDGWTLAPAQPGAGGEWSNLVHLDDLPPPLTPCECDLADTVMVFDDLSQGGGHNEFADNLAASPWIDLGPDGWNNPGPGKLIETKLYAELPLLNYVFVQFNVQWYPEACIATGKLILSAWQSNGFVYYFGGVPQCTSVDAIRGTQIDFSAFVPPGAEQMRIALGILSYCRFYANCSGVSNSTPWLDQIKLGVYGDPNAPLIAPSSVDTPQDMFPQNGTLNIAAPGRIDSNNIRGPAVPEVGSALADTLIVDGGGGGAEVYVQFSVSPGPGTDPVALAAFLGSVSFEETKDGEDWYSAQMDTAELANSPATGSWMTARIEGSPGFSGNDNDTDPNDLDCFGRETRLLNDIFPDDLFTAGTHINSFYKTRFVGGTAWYTSPDTADATYRENEILPSSMGADSTFNCILYVDHYNRGAQVFIEDALTTFVGAGNNYEGTGWDRFDVNAESSQQMSVGRPQGFVTGMVSATQFGADWDQIIGYNVIVWNSGDLNAFNLTKEDGDMLIPWMTLAEFENRNFYGSGDGFVNSAIGEAASEPSARRFLEDYCGVTFSCNTYRDLNCPTGKPQDLTTCINVDPVGGATVAGSLGRLVDHVALNNGCPAQESYDVIGVNPSPNFGVASGDENYSSAAVPGPTSYAAVVNDAPLHRSPTHRTVVDGMRVHPRRAAPSAGAGNCLATDPNTAIDERLAEVLTYLGAAEISEACFDPTAGTGIENPGGTRPTFRTSLANFAPNPLMTGLTGRIQFTMAREGKAKIDIFDVNGRLVKSIFDGIAQEGVNEAFWTGSDETGRQVASGVYFYRLRANTEDFSKKMVVVRNGGN